MPFAVVMLIAAVSGAIASVVGFGIGSLLTPAVATQTGMRAAVALVTVPHLVGTVVRFWGLRREVDRRVLVQFGVPSAAGGLTGALLHAWAGGRSLEIVFGCLLILAGAGSLSGLLERWRPKGAVAAAAGLASGFVGGMVGNQGGIRSAGLLGFDMPKRAFVATATAIALVVDAARLPVYVTTSGREMLDHWGMMALLTGAVVAGTLVGGRVLAGIAERVFRRVVAGVVLLLGAAMLMSAIVSAP